MNPSRALVEIDVPVYNEAQGLRANVELLLGYLRAEFPFRFRVVVVDNASTDATPAIAHELAAANEEVEALVLDRKGRGLALRTAWLASDADVVAYMDVDLSTNLESFLPLVAPLLSGHSEVAIGTRLGHSAHVKRRIKREILSRGYNRLIHLLFRAGFSDAQCGFKAVRADVARRLVPLVEDGSWFFDTELLLLAERNGMRIHEVPVDWIEDLDSRVHLPSTIAGDLAGLWRVRRSFWRGGGRLEPAAGARAGRGARMSSDNAAVAPPASPSGLTLALPAVRQFARFVAVGATNTVVSLVVYTVLLHVGVPYVVGAALAFAAGALNGYVLNRRWTFRARDTRRSRTVYVAVQLGGLLATSGLVWLLVHGGGLERVLAYVAAAPPVTVAMFLANRAWTFGD